MNTNLSKRNVMVGAAAVLVIGAAWLVFSSALRDGAGTPEAAVQAVYQYCQAGHAAQTARYYLGGPQTDAQMRESICNKITQFHEMQTWEWKARHEIDGGVQIETVSYTNAAARTGARIFTWRLIRRGGRWLVVEV